MFINRLRLCERLDFGLKLESSLMYEAYSKYNTVHYMDYSVNGFTHQS